ncbi:MULTISPECIES: hypothetical protein [Dyadobacter]|uniref:Uncharacterized protein n=1 Tax=Dyadobacter chenhuakuii TaxID=2909339 RepID=A0ABY4XF46_9BACT|nr:MULTISPECIES: hypothetical protein [Dyadobacter]MCE7069801.1 hypothetical protein [Dyadobacter sp. CY327]MCF2492124.1 hypothetical protein [Dyadobacter chenhuakuii]USJ28718.1 hypothetical protein NFI80_12615 [Dyadobacter chenhuakuii]
MRQTITVDIINEKALNLLMDMERLELISLRKEERNAPADRLQIAQYKGGMSKQSIQDVDTHLDELRAG